MSARIVYLGFPRGQPQGAMKLTLRHVETLRDLGFEAVCLIGQANQFGTWIEHDAPVVAGEQIRRDDILVLPDDAVAVMRQVARSPQRKVILVKSPLRLAAVGMEALAGFAPDNPPALMTVGPSAAATLRRLLPGHPVEIVPAFADERRFGPREKTSRAIVLEPKKRNLEPQMVQALFQRLYPQEAARPWLRLEGMSEAEVAAALGEAQLYLAMPRFESISLAVLEAMASGCVCAGFTGVGGRDYATPANGFWVPDDDVSAAADALAEAAEVVRAGGSRLEAYVEAGRETAAQWSYARFRVALEDFWMRHAPAARVRGAA